MHPNLQTELHKTGTDLTGPPLKIKPEIYTVAVFDEVVPADLI
jgi:hypothetical protein